MSLFEVIKKTIEYGEKYGCKLKKEQLFKRLISNKIYKKEEIEKIIEKKTNFNLNLVKNNYFSKEKIKKAKVLANKISKNFKSILFLGITGSVAADYPKKNDDIDIIIITKINKLWITRLKLRLFIKINNIPHRKFNKKEKKDDFCFNLWLDEKSLEIEKEKQNLKNAMDLILIKPLINKEKTYEKFINANSWVKKWVATGYFELNKKFSFIKCKKNKNNYLNIVINWLVFWPQFWYMKRRIKKEKIGLHKAFFHN